jgi:hypothetical protein
MIWESWPWKQLLGESELRLLDSLQSVSTAAEDVEDLKAAQLEMHIFNTAYALRKLLDSGKLSFQAEQAAVLCTEYNAKGEAFPDTLTADRVFRFYDFDNPLQRSFAVRDLVNRLIHSCVFLFEYVDENNDAPFAFVFNSDNTRNKIWRIEWVDYHHLLSLVAHDDVTDVELQRDGRGLELWLRSNEPITDRLRSEFVSSYQKKNNKQKVESMAHLLEAMMPALGATTPPSQTDAK